jgi:branched-chain amino acid transport system substrate-binding protein
VGANANFGYDRYFQILSEGRRLRIAPSLGFMSVAMTMNPKPTTIAIVRADTEYGRMVAAGLRETAHSLGVTVLGEWNYPSLTTDFVPIVQAVRAKNPELVFVVSFKRDTEGLIRAADAGGLRPRMFGGIMAGLESTATKRELGSLLNGLVVRDTFAAEPTMMFPGTAGFLKAYAARAAAFGADPLGLSLAPYAYAQMEVLAEAVTAVGSIDHERIADRLHGAAFKTIVGDVKFDGAGEMESDRHLFTQFRNVVAGDLAQFATAGRQIILHPPEFASGELVYPFEKARAR